MSKFTFTNHDQTFGDSKLSIEHLDEADMEKFNNLTRDAGFSCTKAELEVFMKHGDGLAIAAYNQDRNLICKFPRVIDF